MNRKQKIVLWLGIIAFVGIGLFPPWIYSIPSKTIATSNPMALEQRAQWRVEHPNGMDFSDLIFPDNLTQNIPGKIERHYNLLCAPLKGQPLAVRCSLDVSRLLIQWAIVTVVTGGLIATFKDQRK